VNSLNKTTRLKIALLNAENLFLLFDHPATSDLLKLTETQWQRLSSSIFPNKPLKKCLALAKTFQEINPDIILLCEVGGAESLKNFNSLFLNSAYSEALIEGNSDRHIDVGYLVRKNLAFFFDLLSNKNRALNFLYPHERNPSLHLPSHKFSRDALELKLFRKDKEDPFLLILLTHLKSRLDQHGFDPQGFERRGAELNTLLNIYSEQTQKYPRTPILVAGDFNGQAGRPQPDEEFKPIYSNTDLEDVLEIAQIPTESRATYYQIRNSNKNEGRQIDFCFFSEKLKPFLKAHSTSVVRYKDEQGNEIPRPQSLDEKFALPSDHYPIVFELENLGVW
jgi:endonuclease/exonuclease/phosphatase family metal-dependent hydrolase